MSTAREETTRLADLLRRERHALSEFLVALAAFERERRWMELGYASLFDFLRRELGLSAGAAQYRKTAAALIQRYPLVEAALRDGKLCLSSVIEVAKVLSEDNVVEVLPRFFGLSSRDAAFLAATIRPVATPPRRDFLVTPVRAAPVPAAPTPIDSADGLGPADAMLLVRAPEVAGPDRASSAATASPPQTPPNLDRPKVTPLDGERARVNITVSRRLVAKLAAARDILSHSHPGASEAEIIELGIDLLLERFARRRGLGAKPRKVRAQPAEAKKLEGVQSDAPTAGRPPPPSKRSRHVPAEVWRAVWARDGGCCAWKLDGGGACGSTLCVELDHVHGWALGAETTVDECRLLCRHHQDVAARRLYGNELMDRYARSKGPRCSEPVSPYETLTPPTAPASPPPPTACYARPGSPRAAAHRPPRTSARTGAAGRRASAGRRAIRAAGRP
jgi:hypothetical protein